MHTGGFRPRHPTSAERVPPPVRLRAGRAKLAEGARRGGASSGVPRRALASVLVAAGILVFGAPPAAAQGGGVAISVEGPAAVVEGDDAVFTLRVSGTTRRPVKVSYTTGGIGMAAAAALPRDFGDSGNTIGRTSYPAVISFRIPAGTDRSETITLPIFDDAEVEGDESFGFRLSDPESGDPDVPVHIDPARQSTTTVIRDNDISVAIGDPTAAFRAGDAVDFPILFDGATPMADIAVTYRIGGSGVSAGDFQGGTTGTEAFTPAQIGGATPLSLTLTVASGSSIELFTVELTGVSGAGPGVQPRLDGARSTALARAQAVVVITIADSGDTSEGTGRQGDFAPFTVTARGTTTAPISGLTFSTVDCPGCTATPGADYIAVTGGTVPQIGAGTNRTTSFIVRLVEDDVLEAPLETFQVRLAYAPPTGSTQGGVGVTVRLEPDPTAMGPIIDNEIGISIEGPTTAVEGTSPIFVIALDAGEPRPRAFPGPRPFFGEIEIPYRVAPAGAHPASGRDFPGGAFPSGAALLGAQLSGPTFVQIPLPLLADGEDEGAETFTISLGQPSIRLAQGDRLSPILDTSRQSVQVTIADSGNPPDGGGAPVVISIAEPESHVAEGDDAMFTVSATDTTTPADLVITYTVEGSGEGGATAGDFGTDAPMTDFPAGTVTIRTGTEQTIAIPIFDDGEREGAETFVVTLSEPSGPIAAVVHGAAGSATATISPDLRADQRARREQRTRGMLAATHRSAANMATDVIRRAWAPRPAPAAAPNPQSAAPRVGSDTPVRPFETGPAALGHGAGSRAGTEDRALGMPRLGSLLGGSRFELDGEEVGWSGFGEGLAVWGAGAFRSLEGDPVLRGERLDYEGESYGLFVGADKRLELSGGREIVAGAALGWTRSDLDFRDETPRAFDFTGRFESELWSIHPYAALRLSPDVQLWLLAGYGWGDVEIAEREERVRPVSGEEPLRRRVETDSTMWTISAGAEGSMPLPRLGEASQLVVRMQGTRTGGDFDRARFDDGELLLGTRARSWRVAGELEGSHRMELSGGGSFRPFVMTRLRGDAGDDLGDDWELSVDAGGGAELAWPERGLALGVRGLAQLNQGTGQREHSVSLNMSYDLDADGRGLTVSLESALAGSGRLGTAAKGRGDEEEWVGSGAAGLGGFTAPGEGGIGGLGGRGTQLRHSLQGEVGYGLYGLSSRTFHIRGLLTPYARFELAPSGSRYGAGWRFESESGARLGVEGAVDFDRDTSTDSADEADYQLRLKGELAF